MEVLLKCFFHKPDMAMLEFIWDKRVPQLCKDVLQEPRRDGNMALFNLLYYYWGNSTEGTPPAWCLIESSSCAPPSLSALASFSISVRLGTGNNVLVNSTLHIWSQFCKHSRTRIPPLCMPIYKNPIFPLLMQDRAF